MEIWKDIIDNDIYQISNFGNVRSKERFTQGRFGLILRKCKIIKPQLRQKYLAVGLYKNSKFNSWPVHRLVAIHFVDNKQNKPQVNHIDGNKMNNNYLNLEWVTAKENVYHAINTGLRDTSGEKAFKSKLKNQDILDIRENKNNLTQKELGLIYNVTFHAISRIVTRKQWKHIK